MWKIKQMLYAFFWVIPWRLNFICQHFGTLCLFHLHRRIDVELPRRKHTTFRTWQKFEIKKTDVMHHALKKAVYFLVA